MVSLQTTSDGKTWEERIPWRESAKSRNSDLVSRLYSAFSENDRSFAESMVFQEPIWASGVRILMKDPIFFWFGIYQVKTWTKQWIVQLKSGQIAESDECLNVDNGVYANGAEITVRNCIDAIQQLDARELFVLQNNLEITAYNQEYCMESSSGVMDETSFIQTFQCKSIQSCCNDGREKWLLDPKGYMKNMKNSDKCLTIKGSEIEVQHLTQSVASASTSMNDGQHMPKLGIDGGDDSYWASQPGVETAEYKVMFTAQTVKEIVIQWKYIPASFEVECFINGYWRSFASVKGNDEPESKILVGTKTISGVKVLLNEAIREARFNDKVIYGIKNLRIKTGSRKVHLKDCNSDGDTQLNKWFVDDSNFADTITAPKLAYEYQRLYENTNLLLDLIHELITWPSTIEQMIQKAKLISKQTVKIEKDVNSIDIKLENFKSNYLVDDDGTNCNVQSSIGSNSLKPASSCAYIKQLFPYKMTGYYWIQPECATVPIRVFCDYSTSSSGVDYAYYGGLGDSVIQDKIKNLNDVQYYCSKLGLYPVELKSKDQVLLIHRYLEDIGVNFQSTGFIPMGIDYPCSKQLCSGKFNSLNSRQSGDVTEFMKSMIDVNNALEQGYSKMYNSQPNELIGFGLSKDGAMTSKFDTNIPIKGIVCSTNQEVADSQANWINADCNTMPRGNTDFDGEINTNVKVICPGGCINTGTTKIYGTEVFSDDSSVCKAAIHNGVINSDKGGKLEVNILEGRSAYLTTDSNGLKSDNKEKWDRSFITNKYVPKCPGDNFKTYTKSFLEMEETSEENNYANMLTNGNQVSNPLSTTNTLNPATKVNPSTIDNAVQKTTAPVSNNLQKSNTALQNALKGYNPQSDPNSAGNPVNLKIGSGGKLDSTEAAIEKLITLFDLDKNDIAKQVRLVKDTSELIIKLQIEYGPLINSNLAPEAQYEYLNSLELHLKGTYNEMQKALAKAAMKLKKKEDRLAKLKLEKMKYQTYEPYIEKYELPLADVYEVHDFMQATVGPSTWTFSKSDLNGHSNAIGQTSDIQINGDTKERYGSILKLKMKNYYDGKLSVSFLAKDTGRVGFAFRYLDEFNFYAFEMERGDTGQAESGFKRIRKFVNGEPTVLAIENDGGFLQDKWYRIVIDFSFSKFTVKMEEETEKNISPDFEDGIAKVIEGFDGDFAQGGFAFLVNSMAGAYFDRFSVKPNKCINQMKSEETKIFLPPTCSRFKESFFTDLSFL